MSDTGNPWNDHRASFERADRLNAAKEAVRNGGSIPVNDQEEIIRLAIEAHDCMSILGGGEIIGMGPLATAVMEISSPNA